MSLNKVRGVFVSILLLRLVYLLSVTIQAPLGSESLRSNLTRKVLMIFFMLKKQPIVHESLWFFFASSHHTHPAHTLCLRLWLLSAIFAITSVPHSPQEYDVFVMLPGLVDVEKRFVCEAFATLIAEECGHLSFNVYYQLVWWKPIPPKTLTLYLQLCICSQF